MLATALVIAIVFGIVFFVVESTVYQNLDNDLSYEAKRHTKEIATLGDSLYFVNKVEWEEHEHREAQVNPVFIQLLNRKGQLMDKSPNLKEQQLPYIGGKSLGTHFNGQLNNRHIRQVQVPITKNNQQIGYIVAAMSSESSQMVVTNLRNVLLISYPIILLGLFFISRYVAGKNIVPIKNITATTNKITKNNLNERVTLPPNKDELYELTDSINELLQRIQNTLQRERQFTSDASHELRTPLASLRGTLEVLIRKTRSPEEYEEKIKTSLSEIDRMTTIVEQLLLLARFDNNTKPESSEKESLVALVDNILHRYEKDIEEKKLKITLQPSSHGDFEVPKYYANLILDNIINNALKYSKSGGTVKIHIDQNSCVVKDEGVGIKQEDLDQLFNPFFRSGALDHKDIAGNGLGLSIAQKAAQAIGATLDIASKLGEGTTLSIKF